MTATRSRLSARSRVLILLSAAAFIVTSGVLVSPPASAAVANCGPTFSGGDGSSATPYLISTAADLTALEGDSDCWVSAAHYLQTADISMGGATWTSTIGTNATNFNGTFSGGGSEISGLTITISNPYAGLFGYVGSSGRISDLGFTGDVNGSIFVGGLIGYNSGGTVSNSYATGNITGSSDYVGGLIGYNSGGTVSNSYATGESTGNDMVGGLIGWNTNSGAVANSYATGDASETSGAGRAGGLIGYNASGDVSNSHATGNATAASSAGGLIAFNAGGDVSNSHATGDATANGISGLAGGLIGINISGNTVTDAYATGNVAGTYEVGGLIGSNGSGNAVSNAYATGTVTATATSVTAFAGGLIGNNSSNSAVSNAYATGGVTATSTPGGTYAGGLIGNNSSNSDVSVAYATGGVSTTGAGPVFAGGLIGGNSSAVSDAYANGTIIATSTGADAYVGGLIGLNGSGGAASNTYATGIVSATAAGTTYAGGLLAESSAGTWSDSFFLDAGADNGEGTLVTPVQLRDITTFLDAGWSIAAGWSSSGSPVWGICGPANNGYPFLNPTVSTNPCQGSPARVIFTFSLPDGRECSQMSPSLVEINSQVLLPTEDAPCKTMEGSRIIGWTIPTPDSFTGIGSPTMPFAPGAPVIAIDSQQFTAVLHEPIQQYDYDTNIAATDTCTPTITMHINSDGRVHYIWVPRDDIKFARFPTTAPCTPNGHQLIGWNTNGHGTGETYQPGDPLPTNWANNNTNTHTLYAMWGAS